MTTFALFLRRASPILPLPRLPVSSLPPLRRYVSMLQAKNPDHKIQVWTSQSDNPFLNLAVETNLLKETPEDSVVLYLYFNSPCVVIGRNQNPWKEVNLTYHGRGVPRKEHTANEKSFHKPALLRRRSGGGTVWHDPKNLNWCVICPTKHFDRDKHAEMVVRALGHLGVKNVRVNERHDIVMDKVNDKDAKSETFKVSGSAYKVTRLRALHHGTLLLDSEYLDSVSPMLNSKAAPYLEARGSDSVKSKITNLGLADLDSVRSSIVKEFAALYGRTRQVVQFGKDMWEDHGVRNEARELENPNWVYNQTPQFTFNTHPPSGVKSKAPDGFSMAFTARHGVITDCHIIGLANRVPPVPPQMKNATCVKSIEAYEPKAKEIDHQLSQHLVGTELHAIKDWVVTFGTFSRPYLLSNDSVLAAGRFLNDLFYDKAVTRGEPIKTSHEGTIDVFISNVADVYLRTGNSLRRKALDAIVEYRSLVINVIQYTSRNVLGRYIIPIDQRSNWLDIVSEQEKLLVTYARSYRYQKMWNAREPFPTELGVSAWNLRGCRLKLEGKLRDGITFKKSAIGAWRPDIVLQKGDEDESPEPAKRSLNKYLKYIVKPDAELRGMLPIPKTFMGSLQPWVLQLRALIIIADWEISRHFNSKQVIWMLANWVSPRYDQRLRIPQELERRRERWRAAREEERRGRMKERLAKLRKQGGNYQELREGYMLGLLDEEMKREEVKKYQELSPYDKLELYRKVVSEKSDIVTKHLVLGENPEEDEDADLGVTWEDVSKNDTIDGKVDRPLRSEDLQDRRIFESEEEEEEYKIGIPSANLQAAVEIFEAELERRKKELKKKHEEVEREYEETRRQQYHEAHERLELEGKGRIPVRGGPTVPRRILAGHGPVSTEATSVGSARPAEISRLLEPKLLDPRKEATEFDGMINAADAARAPPVSPLQKWTPMREDRGPHLGCGPKLLDLDGKAASKRLGLVEKEVTEIRQRASGWKPPEHMKNKDGTWRSQKRLKLRTEEGQEKQKLDEKEQDFSPSQPSETTARYPLRLDGNLPERVVEPGWWTSGWRAGHWDGETGKWVEGEWVADARGDENACLRYDRGKHLPKDLKMWDRRETRFGSKTAFHNNARNLHARYYMRPVTAGWDEPQHARHGAVEHSDKGTTGPDKAHGSQSSRDIASPSINCSLRPEVKELLNINDPRSALTATWKSFDFFDVAKVRLGDDETRLFFESNEISCVRSGSDSLFVGSFDGFVRIIGPSWKIVKSFQAHDVGTITHMRQVEGTSLLVTIAEDLSNEPVLKTWALDKLEKKTGLPKCLSVVHVNNARKQFPISAFSALDDLTQLAVGFANGNVTLIRGDLVNDLGTKQRIIHEGEEPITGLVLRSEDNLTTLFISTTARILKLSITNRGHAQPPRTVEDSGCAVGCMTVDQRRGDIVVAREDAIYYYTFDGRGPPRAYEAQKSQVAVYQDYVAIVSPPEAGTGVKEATSMRRRFGGAAAEALFNTSTFTLLETELRLVAHSEAVISTVKAVVELWGDLFTILQNGKVYRYHEKTLQQKLELLYQRNLFPLAIELAHKAGMDAKQQQVIFRKFGDSLYHKADYDGAMSQYIRAIDTTEPSQVIRKFLDTQRIHNLIEYLEELHEHHKATADHTTLLLNCYAKLKDIDKLEKFIKSPGDLKFDLDTAISMCRQGGYYDQAAYLAKKHGEEDLVVDILIEDGKRYSEALHYTWQLDHEAAYPCLMKYARVLIENCPDDATQLFIEYYTGKYKPKPIDAAIRAAQSAGDTPVSGIGVAASAVQNLSSFLPLPYMNSSAIATPTSQTNYPTTSDQAIMSPVTRPPPKYTPPPPRTAFSSFIDHPDEFITFLEKCLEDPGAQGRGDADRTDLTTTLFEMYLQKAAESKGGKASGGRSTKNKNKGKSKKPGISEGDDSAGISGGAGVPEREKWEAKAKSLISSSESAATIENSDVLLLSHLSSFQTGTTLVKEQAGLLEDIFRSYTVAKDTRGALNALRKYGDREPNLYVMALSYLVSSVEVLEEAGGAEELGRILKKIDEEGLMAPLQVVQTLAGGDGTGGGGDETVATMGLIKPYLRESIERERREIEDNRGRIEDFRQETEQRREELKDLGSKPRVFQATRCADCGGTLELPAVHFLCKHSFHRRCLKGGGSDGGRGIGGVGSTRAGDGSEDVGECPVCKGQNAAIRAMKGQQAESRGRHDLFKAEIERAGNTTGGDRFAALAGWFGRGVLGGE
ncbi:putative vacuolar membrane protein [Zalerion maritima]|uniref:Vacuolar membrane protein n=1 Tax=Zalerion maritima TaxID=339359 RepID=A0AAD5WSH6_9PEZI|nr:putative vacuolar membrane protein [Zalerion maritima]